MSLRTRIKNRFSPPSKEEAEMAFWRDRATAEGVLRDGELQQRALRNDHYERAYTTHFDLDPSFFVGKRVVDIGCGPRGSLEWAAEATERVGVDPLVPQYRELGIDRHAMSYIHAGAENIPVADGSFDVVCILNALDHVDDVEATIAELTRIASGGATLLLMVEVGHKPTPAEPHSLDWSLPDDFDGWRLDWSKRNGVHADHQLYDSLDEDTAYDGRGAGLLRARFTKV
jgi:SAM-dependent methyltransferase